MLSRSVVLGFHGIPAWTYDRGIARFATEQIRALVELAPDAIAQVDFEPGHPLPARLEGIDGHVRLAASGKPPEPAQPMRVYSVMSPFDPVSIDRIWPAWARDPDVALAVTLYDLIPLLFADRYLADSFFRMRYMVRLGMVRAADVVMTDSQMTADDAVRHLGIDPARTFVIGAGCSEAFSTPDRPLSEVIDQVRREVPAVRAGYLLYTGAAEHRKNIVRLVEAYGLLPAGMRSRHQLVLAGQHEPGDRQELKRAARACGLGDELVFTDRIPDSLLVRLYQGCLGFVFPSLYEGFGLPVLEAMSCGAPVIASDIPVLAELVTDPEARFDPGSTRAIAEAMLRLINEPALRGRLREQGKKQSAENTWSRVASRSLGAYDAALSRRRRLSSQRRALGT